MNAIIPNLWTNRSAADAARFYCSTFREAEEVGRLHYPTEGLPDFQQSMAGEILTIDLKIHGLRISLINAGDEFRPNPAAGFMVNVDPSETDDALAYVDELHDRLSEGGRVLMELGDYPFSPRYAWVEDRYGVSWQLILTNPAGEPRPTLLPALMFCGPAQNSAVHAARTLTELVPGSRLGSAVHYPEPTGPATTDAVMFSDFRLGPARDDPREEFWVTAMDSAVNQDFTFTEGFSLAIEAADQDEIDRLWAVLSRSPENEQCGWCKDQFGLSWQVVPADMATLLESPGAYQRMLEMKKIDIGSL